MPSARSWRSTRNGSPQAMTREMGKVIAEARGDVQEGIDIAYLMAGEGGGWPATRSPRSSRTSGR